MRPIYAVRPGIAAREPCDLESVAIESQRRTGNRTGIDLPLVIRHNDGFAKSLAAICGTHDGDMPEPARQHLPPADEEPAVVRRTGNIRFATRACVLRNAVICGK